MERRIVMIVLPQMVEVSIDKRIAEYYESKGYEITRIKSKKGKITVPKGTKIIVRIEDLLITSTVIVKIKCDYCGETVDKPYSGYLNSIEKSNTKKDCCKKCIGLKGSESRFRYTYEMAVKIFNDSNLEVLIKEYEYVEANEAIPYKCKICNHKSKTALTNVIGGRGCRKCKKKINSDKQKLSYEEVKKCFEDAGCILVSQEYINSCEPLDYICVCGNPHSILINSFKNGSRCKECGKKKQSDTCRTSIDEVRKIFEDEGCTLISTEYTHGKQKLDYICVCGRPDIKTLSKFKSGQRCEKCRRKKLAEHFKHNIEHVREIFISEHCILLSENYKNENSFLEFLCSCGNDSTVTFAQFKMGVRCELCEENGDVKTRRDSGRARYTEDYIAWSRSVLERDRFKCQCCGEVGGRLHAHHKDGFHWCIERRLDITNGASLCSSCHSDFHLIYRRSNNTEAQFNEWIKTKYIKTIEEDVNSSFL